MNTAELPMILFTVIAQMCVGAFVALGAIQVFGRARYGQRTVDRLTDPVLYAIGPLMVLGLLVSMFHMNDVFHVFNVFRHWNSSWLTREIIFGILFAGFGFLFAFLQWFKLASGLVRQIVAIVAGLFGVALLYSMTSIYATLVAVPAWNTWFTPFQFIAVAIILGCLVVCTALVITNVVRDRNSNDTKVAVTTEVEEEDRPSGGLMVAVKQRVKAINAPSNTDEWALTSASVRVLTLVAMVTLVAWIAAYPIYISQLAFGSQTAQHSAHVFTEPVFVWFLVLASLSAVLLGLVSFSLVGRSEPGRVRTLAWAISVALVLALAAALLSRSIFYEVMLRVGV